MITVYLLLSPVHLRHNVDVVVALDDVTAGDADGGMATVMVET